MKLVHCCYRYIVYNFAPHTYIMYFHPYIYKGTKSKGSMVRPLPLQMYEQTTKCFQSLQLFLWNACVMQYAALSDGISLCIHWLYNTYLLMFTKRDIHGYICAAMNFAVCVYGRCAMYEMEAFLFIHCTTYLLIFKMEKYLWLQARHRRFWGKICLRYNKYRFPFFRHL